MAQQELSPPPLQVPLKREQDNKGHYLWLEWFNKLYVRVNAAGQVIWNQISFAGSNLTDIETRNHNDLQNIQGGTSGQYYHLTQAEYDSLQKREDEAYAFFIS